MMAKVGHFTPQGFCELASGSVAYCRGWAAGYNTHAQVDAVVLEGEACQCGPLRENIEDDREGQERRTGCLRCNRWDGPVVLK